MIKTIKFLYLATFASLTCYCLSFQKDDEQYSFRFKSGERDVAECRAVLQNGQLYVEVPAGEIPPGGKEWYTTLRTELNVLLECRTYELITF